MPASDSARTVAAIAIALRGLLAARSDRCRPGRDARCVDDRARAGAARPGRRRSRRRREWPAPAGPGCGRAARPPASPRRTRSRSSFERRRPRPVPAGGHDHAIRAVTAQTIERAQFGLHGAGADHVQLVAALLGRRPRRHRDIHEARIGQVLDEQRQHQRSLLPQTPRGHIGPIPEPLRGLDHRRPRRLPNPQRPIAAVEHNRHRGRRHPDRPRNLLDRHAPRHAPPL